MLYICIYEYAFEFTENMYLENNTSETSNK